MAFTSVSAADESLFSIACTSLYVMTPLTFLALQFVKAPYGKHYRAGLGPSLDPTVAWFIAESPTLFVTLSVFPLGGNRSNPLALAFISLYVLHYIHRTCIYPLHLKTAPSRRSFPLSVALVGFVINILNAYLQTRWISHYADLERIGWLQVAMGAAVFVSGFVLNVRSDRVLVGLKRQGGVYRLPRGGMFEVVTCPNYLGELMEWLGWAVMTWSSVGLAFFLYTAANLVPRARAHRRWYMEKFPEEFPISRKAIVPFLY